MGAAGRRALRFAVAGYFEPFLVLSQAELLFARTLTRFPGLVLALS